MINVLNHCNTIVAQITLKAAFHFRVFHTHVYARKTLNQLKH